MKKINKKVTVTDLLKIVICEKQYLLSKKYSNIQNKNTQQGRLNHAQYEKEIVKIYNRLLNIEKSSQIATFCNNKKLCLSCNFYQNKCFPK